MKDVLRPVVVGRFPCCFSDSNIGSGALAHSLLREVEKGEGYPFWVNWSQPRQPLSSSLPNGAGW